MNILLVLLIKVLNLIIVMFLGGLWHGAQWTFVIWGLIHGSILVIERISRKNKLSGKLPRPIKELLTFIIILIAWVFFRAENINIALNYLSNMFGVGESGHSAGILLGQVTSPMACFMMFISCFAIFIMPNTGNCLKKLTKLKVVLGLLLFVFSISVMFAQDFNPFLYFQF